MATGSFVLYFRVSTERQGASGLGTEAQRAAVAGFLNGGAWRVAAEFIEVESGKNNDRAELTKAITACRVYGARLLIAKLDRLTVGIMAMVADDERRMISARTKAALAAAKARGVKLGGYQGGPAIDDAGRARGVETRQARSRDRSADLAPAVADLRASGATSLREIAAGLNDRGIPTARGGQWSAVQVKRMLEAA